MSLTVCADLPRSLTVCADLPLSLTVCADLPLSLTVCADLPEDDLPGETHKYGDNFFYNKDSVVPAVWIYISYVPNCKSHFVLGIYMPPTETYGMASPTTKLKDGKDDELVTCGKHSIL
jgi:restriction endonuclease S subunit